MRKFWRGKVIHRDGRGSDLEEFNLEQLVFLGDRAVSDVVVPGNHDCALWIGRDLNLA